MLAPQSATGLPNLPSIACHGGMPTPAPSALERPAPLEVSGADPVAAAFRVPPWDQRMTWGFVGSPKAAAAVLEPAASATAHKQNPELVASTVSYPESDT